MLPTVRIRTAILGLALAGAGLTLPALADTPANVAFQPNNHWAQEVGTIDRYDSSHDYAVAIPAGKILQVNLVTLNPNVYFKVKNVADGKQLVDTYQTGATTWSTQPAAAASDYLVHVYVDPAAMQGGESAKYAVQIGRYGPEDMQPATPAVGAGDASPSASGASATAAPAAASSATP